MRSSAIPKNHSLARITVRKQDGEEAEFPAKLIDATIEDRLTLKLEVVPKRNEQLPFAEFKLMVSGAMILSAVGRALDQLAGEFQRFQADWDTLLADDPVEIGSRLADHMTLLLLQEDNWKETALYLGSRFVEKGFWDSMRADTPSNWSWDLVETLRQVDGSQWRFREALESIRGKDNAEALFLALMPHYPDD